MKDLSGKVYNNIVIDFHGPICSTYSRQNQLIVKLISQKNKDITFKKTWDVAYKFLRQRQRQNYLQWICDLYNIPVGEIKNKLQYDSSIYKLINKKTSNFILENKTRIFLYTLSSDNVVSQIKNYNPFLLQNNITIIGKSKFDNRKELLLYILNSNNINNRSTIVIDDKDLSDCKDLNVDVFDYDYPISINNYIYNKICNNKHYINEERYLRIVEED